MMIFRRTALVFGILILGACVPKRDAPPPQPRPQPPVQSVPQPQPLPQPLPPPPASDWRDMQLSPGGWRYSASGPTSEAAFGAPGQPDFVVRCDRARRQVGLGRAGAAGAVMTVRGSSEARSLPASVQAQYAWSILPAGDRLLDGLVFSRGRFAIEAPGQPMLVIPSWPEPARVIEDCRG